MLSPTFRATCYRVLAPEGRKPHSPRDSVPPGVDARQDEAEFLTSRSLGVCADAVTNGDG